MKETDSEEAVVVEQKEILASAVANSHENILTKKKLVVVFGAMALALFLSFVDQSGITIALPYIAEELDASDTISWAGTASLISNTMFMVLFGRFSDIFSRKYVLIGCMVVLALSELAAALAKTSTQLYVFRGLAGIGNGGVTSLSMVIVSDIVTLEDRGKYQGILGSCVGLGNALGPFISSGFITHTSWRKFYYFLFPINLAATGVIFWLVPYTKPNMETKEKFKRIDYFGFFSSSVAIIFLLIPISGGGTFFPWSSSLVIAFLAIGGVATICFILIEAKVAYLPMIPLKLFYTRTSLTCLLLQNIFFGICYYSQTYYYPYFFQVVKGYSAIKSSTFLLAMVIPQALHSTLHGQIISRIGHYIYTIWSGYFLWTLAVCLLCIWTTSTSTAVLVIVLIFNGLGVGAIFQPTLVAAQAQSFKRDRATIISARNVLRSLGGSIGLALSSSIISNCYLTYLSTKGGDLFTSHQIKILKSEVFMVSLVDKYSSEQQQFLREAYMSALKKVFYLWIGCISTCLASTVLVRDNGLKSLDEQ